MNTKGAFKKNPGQGRPHAEKSEFDQFILDIARVTRVTQGGKHMSFRICIILGDRKGRVGFGVAKGKDVQLGVEKAVHQAKKNIILVPIVNETIPHRVIKKFKSSTVMLKPAPRGSGIIAGGAVRTVLDMAGIPNVSSKILGKTKNKIVTVKATFEALKRFKGAKVVKIDAPVAAKEVEVDEKVKIKKRPTKAAETAAQA